MTDVGTTHEDLEHFLGDHHLVGAGLKRDKRVKPRARARPRRIGNGTAFTAVLTLRRDRHGRARMA